MEKYYYHQGRCEANHYLSLNPILYTEAEEGKYQKVEMACDYLRQGKCDKRYTCQLLLDAPETLVDNGNNLRNKKIG